MKIQTSEKSEVKKQMLKWALCGRNKSEPA